uniref:type I protein arginine methyltransferase n=1 Tax=Naja naja TaxID=35670 RepID=A0A8C6Y429_NAJNA
MHCSSYSSNKKVLLVDFILRNQLAKKNKQRILYYIHYVCMCIYIYIYIYIYVGLGVFGSFDGVCIYKCLVNKDTEYCRVGKESVLITLGYNSALLQFTSHSEYNVFSNTLNSFRNINKEHSVFSQRTEDSSASQYFQFYGCLSQQQNMMQDFVRTATYHRAILQNHTDFKDKVVLDVGCGSGILSFFAVQAGARKVYAVEASSVAKYAEILVQSNNVADKISVLSGKIEEITLPECVDVIVSEPMGYMLFNERMLESYLHSKKWLKSNGMMFPTFSDIHLAPFSDEQLYMEHYSRANFWYQQCFYGVNLSSLRNAAVDEYFRQPIVDTFDIRILMARTVKYTVSFLEAEEEDLHSFQFISKVTVWLSTAPTEPLTHWYQVRCLFQTPLFAKEGETLSGEVLFVANKRQSYDIQIVAIVDETGFKSGNIYGHVVISMKINEGMWLSLSHCMHPDRAFIVQILSAETSCMHHPTFTF